MPCCRIPFLLRVLAALALGCVHPFLGSAHGAPGVAPVLIKGHPAHPTRVLAKVARETSTQAQSATLAAAGMSVVRRSQLVPGQVVLECDAPVAAMAASVASGAAAPRLDAGDELLSRIEALRATGLYAYVEPDYIVRADAVPTDTAFTDGTLWGLRNTGQSGGTPGVDIGAVPAWNITTGSTSVVVAVIDSGIRLTHVDLAAQLWTNSREVAGNGRDDDGNGYVDDRHGINAATHTGSPNDDAGHGTMVAGVIGAAANNNRAMVGVAWSVRLMACKFLTADGGGATSDGIECVEYAVANGAKILNCSWGSEGFSQALYDALAAARDRGVLVVAAAGNDGAHTDSYPNYPSCYDLENIISVAAIERYGNRASLSNYGRETVDLGAPGVSIYSTSNTTDVSYGTASGTSLAAPFVSGVAVLLRARHPTISVQDLVDRILNTTVPSPTLNGMVGTGGWLSAHRALTFSPDSQLELKVSPVPATILYAGRTTRIGVRVTDLIGVTDAIVTATHDGGGPLSFRDDGVAPDTEAGDAWYFAELPVPVSYSQVLLQVTATAPGKTAVSQSVTYYVQPPPANDMFAARTAIHGASYSASSNNRGATRETGEPEHAGDTGGASLWWTWTAMGEGTVTITTEGSDFDTILGVYTGSELGALTEVASNDDISGPNQPSRVSFAVTDGATYQIAVDGFRGQTGFMVLTLTSALVPTNDHFARATVISGSSAEVAGTTANATRESGEPEHALSPGVSTSSCWWAWTAPMTGTATVSARYETYGAPYVAVYTGASLASLRRFPGLSTEAQQTAPARVTFPAVAGETYRIALANGSVGSGARVLLSVGVVAGPTNDNFAERIQLSGTSASGAGDISRATREMGEPAHLDPAAQVSLGRSLWWSWVAPEDGTALLVARGTGMMVAASVYTGDSLAGLVRVVDGFDGAGGAPEAVLRFPVRAGVTYQIALDSYGTNAGPVSFTVEHQHPPANDQIENRSSLTGASVEVVGTNRGASQQVGEPHHATGAVSNATVWWEWTAPADAEVYVSSSGYTALAVYTGAGLGDLSRVDNIEWPSAYSKNLYTFRATAGRRYLVVVDGTDGFIGEFTLSILVPSAPANDRFADRVVLAGAAAGHVGDALGATVEAGEPALLGTPTTASVWFSWTAPISGTTTLAISGQVARYGVFTGSSPDALVPWGAAGYTVDQVIQFSVVAGMEYQLLLDCPNGRIRRYQLALSVVAFPANDDFNQRTTISGEEAVVRGTTDGASREPGEPTLTGQAIGGTIWWTWTAPRTGRLVLSTVGSSIVPYVGVYTGSSVSALSVVASTPLYLEYADKSRLVAPVTGGVTYHIASQGYGLVTGDVVLRLQLVDAPPNDDFAARTLLVGSDVEVAATNLGALPETGDPAPVARRGGTRTVWWSWTPTRSGRVVVDTWGAPFDPHLGIYSGSSLGSLGLMADNNPSGSDFPPRATVFDAVAGVSYSIALAGRGEGMGSFSLRVREVVAPANDLIANPRVIAPEGGIDHGSNLGADFDIAEAYYACPMCVWWTWTASASGPVGVSTAGSDFDTELRVYPGSSIYNLGWTASNSDDLRGGFTSHATFMAVAGTSYRIAVGGARGAMGAITLEVRMGQLPQVPVIEASTLAATASQPVVLRVSVPGATEDMVYVWSRTSSVIPGVRSATLELPCVQHFQAGVYTVTAYNFVGAAASSAVSLGVSEAAPANSRLTNLSARALCQAGDGVLIPGFVVEGAGTKRMLIRGIGARLTDFGVSGALGDPQMMLTRDGAEYSANDDWGANANAADIISTAAGVGAFSLRDGSKDAALLLDLPAGRYTVVTSGKDDTEGVAMVELYDAQPGASSARVVNISNRGFVGRGDSIMIPGFVVSEEGPRRFLIRAVGYTLGDFGVSGTLTDSQLAIYRRIPGTTTDELILTNDSWMGPGSEVTVAVQEQIGAFALHSSGLDAAFVVTLPPGIYTVHASGKDGQTGVALVEIYLVP